MTKYPLEFDYPTRRMQAMFRGQPLADSTRVVTVRQHGQAPRHYFPREDVDMTGFLRADHSSYCRIKGDARYYTLIAERHIVPNCAWSYEGPFEIAEPLRGMIAFDPAWVSIEEGFGSDRMWAYEEKRARTFIDRFERAPARWRKVEEGEELGG